MVIAEEQELINNQANSFQVSACVTSANILLAEINYMTETESRGGAQYTSHSERALVLSLLYFPVMLLFSVSLFLKLAWNYKNSR